ncbi:MAG: YfbK domain-containing protein, partial [Alphaproteobacteria bacterium]
MSTDLDRLQSALQAFTPRPDGDAKARALALAQESFSAHQEFETVARPTPNRLNRLTAMARGVGAMFANPGLRPALAALSGLGVIALTVMIIVPYDRQKPELLQPGSIELDAASEIRERNAEDIVVGSDMAEPPPALQATLPPDGGQVMADASSTAPQPTIAAFKQTMGVRHMAPSEGFAGAVHVPNTERFANASSNPLKITVEEPVSTLSIDVDTASYAFVRAALMAGSLPVEAAVRVEEMINYFSYDYTAPSDGNEPFSTNVALLQTPWNPDTQLVHIAIQGQKPAIAERPPLDLVFLIDTSGSMQDANKLPLLKQSFRLLLGRLRPEDRVAIVTYAGSSGVVLEATSADQKSTILRALERLQAGGSTAGEAGLIAAYALAEDMRADDRVSRVLLATDGDFNVGISEPAALKRFIANKREGGIYLSVLGFGRDNYDDALMQVLAQNGNGTAAYIDTLSEAQKVLVDQVSGALFPIANDVKIQIEFNPAVVAEYRLIGYE